MHYLKLKLNLSKRTQQFHSQIRVSMRFSSKPRQYFLALFRLVLSAKLSFIQVKWKQTMIIVLQKITKMQTSNKQCYHISRMLSRNLQKIRIKLTLRCMFFQEYFQLTQMHFRCQIKDLKKVLLVKYFKFFLFCLIVVKSFFFSITSIASEVSLLGTT